MHQHPQLRTACAGIFMLKMKTQQRRASQEPQCKCLNRRNPSCMASTYAAWYSECVCNFKLHRNATDGCQESWHFSELQLRTGCSCSSSAAGCRLQVSLLRQHHTGIGMCCNGMCLTSVQSVHEVATPSGFTCRVEPTGGTVQELYRTTHT
jgi:hypothetical protein